MRMLSILRRHRRKVVLLVLLVACAVAGIAYAASPVVRGKVGLAWQATITWAGFGGEPADTGKVFWCPMHPQIKSKKENAVCPICNMALVELEGGTIEAPQHLTLTARQVQQAGVATAPVLRRELYREINTTGRIDYDERRYAGISCWVRGKSRVDKLHVNFTGEVVDEGDVIAEIYSPQLITAQEELLQALKNRRERPPASTRFIEPLDLVESAREKLRLLGLKEEQIAEIEKQDEPSDHIPVHAPISGTVIERHVQEGQYVNEGDWLFHLADLSQLWLFVDIYEDELSLVDEGTPVELSVRNGPDETFSGTVAYVEPKVRPQTRTAPVRIDIDNREGKLLPGMFARARLRHAYPSVLAVSESAVLWSGQRAVVIVKSGEGTFTPHEVQLGHKWLYSDGNGTANDGDSPFGDGRSRYHEVLAGLAPGAEVVTTGAFLLNAESQLKSVLTKMLRPQSQRASLEDVLDEPVAGRLRAVLDTYFNLSGSLAADKLEDVPARMATLSDSAKMLAEMASESDSDDLLRDAARFHDVVAGLSAEPPKDAVDARTRFGRISRELTRLLVAHGGATLFDRELFQFECGMAKVGYERWLWWSPEIHNPYMGQRMLNCGKKLDVLEP